MTMQYSSYPAPNCFPDRQYVPYNPAAFHPARTSTNTNKLNNYRLSAQNYTGIYNGNGCGDRNGGIKPTRPVSYAPPASNVQYYQAYRANVARPSVTTIPAAPTRPPPPPPARSPPAENNGPARSKHLRRLSPLIIPASSSPSPIFLKPEPPRLPTSSQQYRPYRHSHRPQPPLLRPEPQRPPRPVSAEFESFVYQNPCMLPPMTSPADEPSTDDNLQVLAADKAPGSAAPSPPPYSLPSFAATSTQLRRSKASRRSSRNGPVTPRRASAGPRTPAATAVIGENADTAEPARAPHRKFSFEEESASPAEERLSVGALMEEIDSVARTVSLGSSGRSSSGRSSMGSEDEAVTPVAVQTPAEYRQLQKDALRELLGWVEETDVERVVAEFGLGGGDEVKGAVEAGVVELGQGRAAMERDEDEEVMAARGLVRLSAEGYRAETEDLMALLD